MTRYITKRLAWAIATVFLTSTLVFFMTAALPGDAARTMLGPSATPERVAALNQQLGLDKPMLTQYWTWLTSLMTGDLGESAASGLPVWNAIAPRLADSLVLFLIVVLVAFPVAFGIGVATAAKKSSKFDSSVTVMTLVLVAIPEFVVGIALIFLLGGGVLPLFPAVSTVFPGESLWTRPLVLALPALTAVVAVTPYMMRMVRAVVIEVLDSEHIEMARLGGLSEKRVLLRHALPNAVAPVTQVCALILVYLVGGMVIVESIFAFPGIGSGLVDAVQSRDLPQVQGIAVILIACSVLFYLAADLITLAVSPRSRTALS